MEFILSVLRVSAPLILAAQAGFLSERSGIVQIGLEGMMLVGALLGSIGALLAGPHLQTLGIPGCAPWVGFLCAGMAGAGLAALYAFFTIERKANGIVAGTALNILAAGLCPFITKAAFGTTGSTASLPIQMRWTWEPIFLCWGTVAFMSYFVNFTKWGLLLRCAGEKSLVVTSAGFSVRRIRWSAVVACGALAGGAGSFLSLSLASNYSPGMTGGRGFMALAALICGKWRPLPTALIGLLFAAMEALEIQLQTGSQWATLVQILPYLATIVALAGFFGHSRPPKELTS